MSDCLWPHSLQHARLPCPSPSPWVCSHSCPLSWWCHPTISSSVVPFSSCLQSFPASGSFLMSRFFALSDQSIGASASASVLPMSSPLSSNYKSQGSRQGYDLPSRKYLEAGVRDRESADLLPCCLYPKEYFNKPSMCVSLDAHSSCLCLKISKRTSFARSPGAFQKVICLELSSGVG